MAYKAAEVIFTIHPNYGCGNNILTGTNCRVPAKIAPVDGPEFLNRKDSEHGKHMGKTTGKVG
jgi:hypothetical protein